MIEYNTHDCNKRDCFAYDRRRMACLCLENTNFKGRPCPFYKTKEQNDKECESAKQRYERLKKEAGE